MRYNLSRRDVLKVGAAVALSSVVPAFAADKPIKMGFIGVGARGTALLRRILLHDEVQIPAVCDIDQNHLNRALDLVEKARGKRPEGYSEGPTDYRRLLARDDINSVLIGTPQETHAVMSIDALKAGKFVGAEVPACCTIEECHQLVRAQRETKTGYMMLENILYPKPTMQVQNMVDNGLFGELTYAVGAYVHEIRPMRFKANGSLTWRGENVRDNIGVIYPTHAVGPVARWMGINKTDKFVSLVAMASKAASLHEFAAAKFGPDSPAAKIDFKNGDTNHALIKTARGRLIEIRYDTHSPRPHAMGGIALQGTKGAYEAAAGQRVVCLEGRSEGEKWEPLEKYEPEFAHPRWVKEGAAAAAAGHGGADHFVIVDFLNAIRTGESPIDVIDAVAWSCIRPLSADSIAAGSKPVEVPDFSA